MSSVAYPARPSEPGWWRTAWLMIVGWLSAAVALGCLYVVGFYLGAIGRNTTAGAVESGPGFGHSIDGWPFPANGTWSLFANLAVWALALAVTTVAVAFRLRQGFASVSEGRLGVVLLVTGGVPYVTSPEAFPLVFVIAVSAVRWWVVRDELRFPRRLLAGIGLVLALVIGSYGVVHPVWVDSATAWWSARAGKRPAVMLVLQNSGRVSVEVQRLSGGFLFSDGRVGLPGQDRALTSVRIPPGQSREFTLRPRPGSCSTALWGARLRYRVLGVAASEPLVAGVSGLRGCS